MSPVNNVNAPNQKPDAVYHTGLYGDRAEAFFKWFRYQLLEQYDSSDVSNCIEQSRYYGKKIVPGHLAKIGMLMSVERAPNNEIVLGWYRYIRDTDQRSFCNTSLSLIANQIYYKTFVSLPSSFPAKTIYKLRHWIAVYAMKFAKENIFERHISDMTYFRNKYQDHFNKMPKYWPSAFGPVDTELDRTSDLCRSSITYQTSLETNFALHEQELIPRLDGMYRNAACDDIDTTTLALSDAEICFMCDLLLGRDINKYKYGSVDKSQFHGTPANPIIAECEAERRQLLESASEAYLKGLEVAKAKASDLYRELMEKFRAEATKQQDELYAKLCAEITETYNKKLAKAQELSETVKRLTGTANETSDVASLAAMF